MDIDRAVWPTSTYTNSSGGACVEVAELADGHHAIRDSKNPTGPALMFTTAEWAAFTTGVRTNEFS
ncbi:MAG: DUF397 domain-containing protein [Pseudonocardiaceae bacterium]